MKALCFTNREAVKRQYNIFDFENNTAIRFDQFTYETFDLISPDHGEISYAEGRILCSIHNHTEVDDKPDIEVPWLSNNRLILIMVKIHDKNIGLSTRTENWNRICYNI